MEEDMQNATGRNVLLFMIPTLGVYALMLLFSIPEVLEYSNGLKILDLMPTGYSSEYAQKLFKTLGKTGREIYLFRQIPLDMIYPALFAKSFSLLLAFIFKKAFSAKNKIQKLYVLPVFAGLFDYLENIGIIVMLSIYPDFQPWIANTTNVFSVLKSLSTTIVFLALTAGIISLLFQKTEK